ncbi:MAG TPA: alanyl-tRNA editing protein [Candidatus Polarisedimenticolaceae bacterium]
MTDRKIFLEDPGRSEATTTIVERGTEDGRFWVRLAETIFYPEGGGQPADRGTIGGVAVVDVQARGPRVLHFLERSLDAGEVVRCLLDAERRLDHRQQHTAQHLLTAILQDRHGLPTTSFHLGERYTAIEVEGAPPSPERLRAFEDEVEAEIRRDLPVETRWVAPPELAALPVRTRGLPDGHAGPVRLVEIPGIDLNTCGGTHVLRLGEIRLVHLLDATPARGGSRIRFLAGGRVTRALRDARAVEESLKARIGTAPEAFAEVLDRWQGERKRLEKRVRLLEGELAALQAESLASRSGSWLVRAIEDAGPDRLRTLAKATLALRPDAVVVLAGRDEASGEAAFLVQSGPTGPEDVAAPGERVRALMGAKGGGRGRVVQGRGGSFPTEAALRAAAEGS